MSENKPRRLKQYTVTAEAALHLFRDGNKVEVVDGIPTGAELHNHGYNPRDETIYITVEHESFPLVHEGEVIPIGECTVTNLVDFDE